MSYTTMYKIGGKCEEIAEFNNAHRGAMYVWNQIAKDYFGLKMFPFMDLYMQKKIWNAHDEKPIKDYEYIVLAASMDKATTKATAENLAVLIKAFREYGLVHPDSSYGEQAEALNSTGDEDKILFEDTDYIAWCQTSCGEFWAEGEYSEEDEECSYYNPNNSSEHFDVVSEYKAWIESKS